jgi:dihydrofolate reductase
VIQLAVIVAVADNGVIGGGNRIPWRLPRDLRHFRQLTTGHTVIMGRRTFESLGGRALPNRRNLVLSRTAAAAAGVEVFPSLAAALAACAGTVFVCGGAAVYREALPQAQLLYLTRVHAAVEGDTRFPAVDFAAWDRLDTQAFPADARNPYAVTFEVYGRRSRQALVSAPAARRAR